jgi:regulatory protein
MGDIDLDLGPGEGEPEPAAPPRRSETERAIDLAYKAVARRERTVAELRTALERRRVEPDAIEAAVEELTAAGFLDDARYAIRFAEDKRELAQWGSERIARDLTRRGVAADLIDAALCDRTRQAELGTALILLEQRFPSPPADDRERDCAWRLLVRRGFAPELAYEAVRELERRPRAA